MSTSSFATNALRAFVLGLVFCAEVALAAGPALSYNPGPDAAPVVPSVDCSGDISVSPAAEVDFANGSCPPGEPCTIAIGIQASGGVSEQATYFNSCSIVNLEGDAAIALPGNNFALQFDGGQTSTGAIPLTCARGTTATRARLCCKEVVTGGPKTAPFWDIACPAAGAPELQAAPAAGQTLSMTTLVGQSTQAVVTISNAGSGALTLAPSLPGSGLSLAPAGAQTVTPGNPKSFVVTCASPVATTIASTLTFETNDADEGVVAFPVSCVVDALVPQPVIAPAEGSLLQLTSVVPNDAHAGFTISNDGNGGFQVTSVAVDGPLSVTPATASIAPRGEQAFDVACDGAQPVSYSGVLTVHTDVPGRETINLLVQCDAQSPELEIDAAPPIDISSTQGAGNVERAIRISNQDGGVLQVAVGLVGASGGLTVSPALAAIEGGRDATFTIACPRAAVGQFTATLEVASNDPDGDEGLVRYPVTCNITATSAPEFTASPAPGALAIATPANTAGSVRVRVANVGTLGLQLSAPTEGTAGGVVTVVPSATLPATLAPGATLDLDVRCLSAAAGTYTDTFRIGTNDADEPLPEYTVSCTVTAAPQPPELQATPAVPGPLTITTGFSGSTSIALANTGTGSLQVALDGLTSPLSLPRTVGTVAPGTSETFTINCASRSAGTYLQTLTITTNDADEGTLRYDVVCHVQQPSAQFHSDPQPDADIALSAPAATDARVTGTIQISNVAIAGGVPMTVVAGGLAVPLSASPAALTVPPNGIVPTPLTLTCEPRSVGGTKQQLVLDTNAPNADPVRYSVSCSGTPGPDVDAIPRPGPAVLAMQATFKESTRNTIRVYNRGATTLRITSFLPLTGLLALDGLAEPPIALSPGTFIDVGVTCGGLQSGFTAQTLVLNTNDPDETQQAFGIRCRVAAPDLLFEADFEGPTLIQVPIDDEPVDG